MKREIKEVHRVLRHTSFLFIYLLGIQLIVSFNYLLAMTSTLSSAFP